MSSLTEETTGYRPVSAAAVAALVAGLLSAAALVSPFFWVVPLLAIGLASLGLADVARTGAEKAGRAAALVGLALAVGFGAQALSVAAARDWITASRARAAATLWIEALRDGRLDDARSMCLPDAVKTLEQLAERLTACGTAAVQTQSLVGNADAPEHRIVRAGIGACTGGPVELDIHLAPSAVTRPEGAIERWMVVKCELR